MRTFYLQEEIDEYNKLTAEEIKEKRKKYKVRVIKSGMRNIKSTTGQIISTAATKAFFTSTIGLGAVGMCTGFVTKEPFSAILGIMAGGSIGTLGVLSLKDANEYIGVIELMHYLKTEIEIMKMDLKNTNSYFPLPEERNGESNNVYKRK